MLPAARIAASVAWSSGAPGVVTWTSWRSRRSPTLVSTVPTRPVEIPAASSAATARNDVVVLPSVPVIPTMPRSRDGSPDHQPAACARAGLAAATTTWGRPAPGTGRSTTAAAAPAAAARVTKSCPSTWKPGTATNSDPGPDLPRILRDAGHARPGELRPRRSAGIGVAHLADHARGGQPVEQLAQRPWLPCRRRLHEPPDGAGLSAHRPLPAAPGVRASLVATRPKA